MAERSCEEIDAMRHDSRDTWKAPSGARTSGQLLPYHLIPWEVFAHRLAARYHVGCVIKGYGEDNWRRGLNDRTFILDRVNHMLEHAHLASEEMRLGQRADDDNLAAVIWGAICLMAAQDGAALCTVDPEYKGERVKEKEIT